MAHEGIDIGVIRAMRTKSVSMVNYYSSDKKVAQNAALIGAGLPPLHSERQLQWDQEQAAISRREVEVLDAILAHFGEPAKAEAA